MAGAVYCNRCGSRITPGMRFCTSCGQEAPLTCSRCGTSLSRRDRVCRLCGAPAQSEPGADRVSPNGKTESFPPVSVRSGLSPMWIAAALVLVAAVITGGVLWSQRSAAGSTPLAGTPQFLVIQLPTPTATHPALGAERTRVPLATPTPTVRPESTATSAPVRPQVARVIPTRSDPGLTPTPTHASRGTAPAVSLQGRIAFKSDRYGRTGLYLMNPDGTDVERLSSDTIYNRARDLETLSPDGLLRLRVLDNNGSYDVYVGPADEQRPPTFITSNAAQDYDPVWSPAGNQIAFVSLRQGRDDIFVMSPDGRNDRPLTHNDALDKHPSWSPDADQIAFGSDRDGHKQIYVMNADGTNQINISGNDWNDWDPIWLKR